MLIRIRLKNFQKHRELEVTFNGGLTALRGSNEAGKSTLLRAICYALFGVKGLGATLEELVTWGEDVASLRVQLEMAIDGVSYSVSRGKRGAQIDYDGGNVTGQNEVTAFICRLLKCDAGAATRLVLANQNEIRGALEAGPAKTTELIESLAEFDQIDNLIELMQEKLTLGSTTTVEQAINTAEAQLAAAQAAAVKPDLPMLDSRIEDVQELLQRTKAAVDEAGAALATAMEDFNDGKLAAQEFNDAARAAAAAEKRALDLMGEVAALEAVKPPAPVDVAALRGYIDAEREARRLDDLRQRVLVYAERGEGVTPAPLSLEDLEADIEKTEASLRQCQAKVAEHTSAAKLLRQQVTQGSCGFCGQDFSEVPEVKEKNADLLERALEHEQSAEAWSATGLDATARLASLRDLKKVSAPALAVLAQAGEHARRADDFLPPRLEWVGPVAEGGDRADWEAQISAYERADRAYQRAAGQLEAMRRQMAEAQEAAIAAHRRLDEVEPVDLDALRAAVEAARDRLRPLQQDEEVGKEALRAAERAKEQAVAAYQRALATVDAAKATLAQRRAELDALEFNNALLKRVRQCRPQIADQLWNLVLSAVSTYFSEIRGTKSRVRKTGDGFTVDGHVVGAATLSGSTLDALGLAIRVALVRTFMPTAPFFILDEPASACDDDRTNNMLGFLAGCGFKQVLLVTHEDVSQAVADNVVTI